MAFNNTFDGGTDGVAVTTGNSGGASGDAFHAIYGTGLIFNAAAAQDGSPMGATVAASAFGGGQWTISTTTCAAQIKFTMKALSTGDAQILQLSDGGGRIFSVHVNSVGKLRADDATGLTGVWTSAAVLTVGQSYLVKIYALAGSSTSNGAIKVAFYAGNSQTAVETPYSTTAANLGAGRTFTISRGGKLNNTAEAYDIEGPFTVDPTATDLIPFPVVTLAVPASATATGAPAPVVSASATVIARPASATAIGAPAVVSAEADAVGDGFPAMYGGAIAPTVTAGGGVTVLPKPVGSSGAMPPASVTAASDATVTVVMTMSAVGVAAAPIVSLASTGTAAVSGSGTLAAAGTPAEATTATVSGGGVLTAVGSPLTPGAAAVSGGGVLSATGSPSLTGGASLTGAGTLVSSGVPGLTAGATAAGTGVLAVAGTPGFPVAIALSGSGTLTVTAGVNYVTAVPLSGAGALTIAPLRPSITDTATLAGGGVLTVTAAPRFTGAINLTGVGTLAQLVRDLTLVGTPLPNRWASRPKVEVS